MNSVAQLLLKLTSPGVPDLYQGSELLDLSMVDPDNRRPVDFGALAAHLAGVIAAHTTLPVLGIPIDSSALQGMDALLATVQMPPGIPVSTMAIGKSGAHNAGITAAQIIGVSDPVVAKKLVAFKKEMADKVAQKAASFA